MELLGGVHGSGYKEGAALVRRGDGQMVHLGPLMYGLLEAVDGERDNEELAEALSQKLGRRLGAEHIERIAQKLAAQGLLAGSEHRAPPKRNPLLALRWKVLVTNPAITRRLTAPFTFLFRPWVMWPILAGFVGVFWFVLFHKGVASATSQAFHNPGLLLLVFVLAVASAGFHELGHAAACRYGGATPGGWGWGCTWSGRRSTPTSPTPTASPAATGCGSISAACTSTRWSRWSRWRSGWSGARTRCCCSSRCRCCRWSSSSRP